jgi:hypothetical protein
LVAIVERDVIGGRVVGLKANAAAHHKGDRLRFGFSNNLRQRRSRFIVVHHLVSEFTRAVGCPLASPGQRFRVHDLIGCSLVGHRLWCEATKRPDRFLKLAPIYIMHNKVRKRVWLRAGIRKGVRSRANVTTGNLSTQGFNSEWIQVKPPDGYVDDTSCWEMSSPLKYKKDPTEVLEELSGLARRTFYRSLTVSEPFRNVYVYIPPRRFKKHHQMASRYVLLYFLGSVTRYHPADFDDYMNSEFGPFLAEFLASEPSQMLFEMACLFAKREVVSVGLA